MPEAVLQLVSFPEGDDTLCGFLSRPSGAAPFPAIVWSHGSEPDPSSGAGLAAFYRGQGYVFFAPHRRGHGSSPGEYPIGALRARFAPDNGRVNRRALIAAVIELQERTLAQTTAAVGWLASQPFVDADRIALAGVSHGAIQTLLAAEADIGGAAHVAFAPGAMAWEGNPELQDRLCAAAAAARTPIFVAQARNDHSLGPVEALGPELARKGPPSRARVYPAYGDHPDAGHGAFALRATGVWGEDVCAFLAECRL